MKIISIIIFLFFMIPKTSLCFDFKVDTVFSDSFGENRKIAIYLPLGYKYTNKIPLIITTDGQLLKQYVSVVDSLIENKQISPIAMVGVFSDETKVDGTIYEYRNFEYIENIKTRNKYLKTLYKKNVTFFTKELIKYLERRGINTSNKNFYGTSNGAAFGISLSFKYPLLFKNIICFSVVNWTKKKIKTNTSKYILAYGSQEPLPFIMNNKDLVSFLNKKGIHYNLNVYDGGHNNVFWINEFVRVLKNNFL